MTDLPGWIELLFRRPNAWHPLRSAFLLNSYHANVAEAADAQPNGRHELRQAALNELESDNAEAVALALVMLGVVGLPDDLSIAENLVQDPSDLIRRAAKTCCFELRQRSKASESQ